MRTRNKRVRYILETLKNQKIIKTQREFAEKTGINEVRLSNIKLDKTPIKDSEVEAICKAYPQFAKDWLLGEDKIDLFNQPIKATRMNLSEFYLLTADKIIELKIEKTYSDICRKLGIDNSYISHLKYDRFNITAGKAKDLLDTYKDTKVANEACYKTFKRIYNEIFVLDQENNTNKKGLQQPENKPTNTEIDSSSDFIIAYKDNQNKRLSKIAFVSATIAVIVSILLFLTLIIK